MNLKFDLNNVKTTEFGIGRDNGDAQDFSCVSVDDDVQSALHGMVVETWNSMQDITTEPEIYDPSEKYGSSEYVFLPFGNDMSAQLRTLHKANNLEMDSSVLSNPSKVFCYFARLTDSNGLRLTALRRATQFKGVLKNRLIRLVTDALKIIEDNVFKLDRDFDLLIDADRIHILRPRGFEFMGQLEEAVLAAVPKNIEALQKDIGFVKFDGIQDYARKHPRAARYLASIRTQKETKNIDMQSLKKLCKKTGVEVHESDGAISIEDSHVMGFLEVLDRRRYEIELVKDSPERYRAPSRQILKNKSGGNE
ncbi:MAG: Kiwa anti-phage protein KwaB-like domain-containing protein [Leptospirillum sp.]|jgi:hypothetical protein